VISLPNFAGKEVSFMLTLFRNYTELKNLINEFMRLQRFLKSHNIRAVPNSDFKYSAEYRILSVTIRPNTNRIRIVVTHRAMVLK